MDKKSVLLQIMLFLLLVITFYPLLKIGFVTGDDLEYFVNSDFSRWGDISRYYAEGTGRFHYLLVFWSYFVPYIIDSQVYYYAVLIIPLLIAFFLYIRFVKKYVENEYVAFLVALFYLIGFQIFGGHTPPAAYPLFFALSAIFLCSGLLLLMRYYAKNRFGLLLMSAFLIFCSTLFYEACMLNYIPVLLIVLLRKRDVAFPKKKNFRFICKELLPYILFGLIYLLIYTYFYYAHPSQYEGNSLITDFAFVALLKKIGDLAFFAFPFSSFLNSRFFLCENLQTLQPCYYPFFSVFLYGGWLAYLKGFAALLIFYLLIPHIPKTFSYKILLAIAGTTLFIPFLFAVPLAVSNKYFCSIPHPYPISFFSFFYVIIFLTTIYIIVNQLIKNKIVNRIFQILVGISIFIVTLFTQYTNEKITDDLQLSSYRFSLIDNMLTAENIHEGDVLYFGEIHKTTSYYTRAVTHQQDMFAAYVFKKSGIHVHSYCDYNALYQDFKETDAAIKILHYSQADKTGESFLSMANCTGKMLTPSLENLKADSLFVGYLSVNKRFSVSVVSDSLPLAISGTVMPSRQGRLSYANLYYFGNCQICTFNLTGFAIYPSTLILSNQQFGSDTYQIMSHFPFCFEQRYSAHYAKKIQKDQLLRKAIEEKAQKQGVSLEQAAKGDALWLIYYDK